MKRNYISLFALLWMFVIFKITASPSATGSSTLTILQNWFGVHGFVADSLNFIIRKFAHVTVFGLLAIFFYFVFKKNRYLWAWICTTVYAATDEFHQSLVVGRTASIYDVMLDSFGAAVALLLLVLLKRRIFKEKVNQFNEN